MTIYKNNENSEWIQYSTINNYEFIHKTDCLRFVNGNHLVLNTISMIIYNNSFTCKQFKIIYNKCIIKIIID